MTFRKMRRFKQQLSQEECEKILVEQPRGVLSLIIDDGYPYGIPLDHWYDPETGHLYFHGARSGQKIDALKARDKVSYCVYDQGYREGDDWPLHIKSVVVLGRMRFVSDPALAEKIARNICAKFTDDQAYVEQELARSFKAVQCLEMVPEHITGKLVKES